MTHSDVSVVYICAQAPYLWVSGLNQKDYCRDSSFFIKKAQFSCFYSKKKTSMKILTAFICWYVKDWGFLALLFLDIISKMNE